MENKTTSLTAIDGGLDAIERDTLNTLWSHSPLEVIDEKIARLTKSAATKRNFRVIPKPQSD